MFSHSSENSCPSTDFRFEMYRFANHKYNYASTLILYAFLIHGGTIVVGAEITTVTFIHHACGLYNVMCYRINQVLAEESPQASASHKNRVVCKEIIYVAKLHKRALQSVPSFIFLTNYKLSNHLLSLLPTRIFPLNMHM
ncbi:uncharacterized protein LOC143182667 [Calliopsis andreniformis]|uniref:uncharacterized protein LOC143182667 n=1 Tax=Calliopsis andreniformis TaxID=337506 RepID=UPI003FCD2C90